MSKGLRRDMGSHDTSPTRAGRESGESSVYADVKLLGSGMAMQGTSNGITGGMGTGTKLRPSMGAGMSAGIEQEEEGIETESWELRTETVGGEYNEDDPVSTGLADTPM